MQFQAQQSQQLIMQQQSFAAQNQQWQATNPSNTPITNQLTIELDAAQQVDSDHAMNSKSAGRWTAEEHALFLQGLDKYNKQWKMIAELVRTRTVVQIRTHAQKYFQKLNKNKAKANQLDEFTASTDEYDAAFSFSSADSRKNSISLPDHSPLNNSSVHSYSTDNTTLASNVTSSEGESDAERATSSDVQFSTSPADALASQFPGTLEATLRQRQNVMRTKSSDPARKRSRDNMKAGSGGSSSARSPKKSNTSSTHPATVSAVAAVAAGGKPVAAMNSATGSAPRATATAGKSTAMKNAPATAASAAGITAPAAVHGIAIARPNFSSSAAASETFSFPDNFGIPAKDAAATTTAAAHGAEHVHSDDLDLNFMHMLDKFEWLPEDADGDLYHSRANSPFTDSASTVSTSAYSSNQHISAHDLLHLAEAHPFCPMVTDADPTGGAEAPAAENTEVAQQNSTTYASRVQFSNVISELKLVTEIARNGSSDSDHISLFNLIQQKGVALPGSSGSAGKLPSMKTLVRTLASSQHQQQHHHHQAGLAPMPSSAAGDNQLGLDREFSKFILEDCNFLNDGDDFMMADRGASSSSDAQLKIGADVAGSDCADGTNSYLRLPEGSTADGAGGAMMISSPSGGELFVQDTTALVNGQTLLQNPKQLSVLHSLPMSVRASDAAAAAIVAAQAGNVPRRRGRPRKHPLPVDANGVAQAGASPAKAAAMRKVQEKQWQNMNNAVQPHVLRNTSKRLSTAATSIMEEIGVASLTNNSSVVAMDTTNSAAEAAASADLKPEMKDVCMNQQIQFGASMFQADSAESDAFDLLCGSLDAGMLEDFE